MGDLDNYSVIIVGAGPVGLLTAVRLGRANIRTLLLERHKDILPTTRACVYQPVVIPALREIGVLSTVVESAFQNNDGITWRNIAGEPLGHLPIGKGGAGDTGRTETNNVVSGFDGVLLMGQQRLAKVILNELEKYPSVEVRWNTTVTSLEQVPSWKEPQHVVIECENRADKKPYQVQASWVLGTDGANSKVRSSIGVPFEGFTWPKFKIIGADVWHDFAKSNGYNRMNFIVDPDKWAVIIYTGQDRNGEPYGADTPLWRVAYGVPPESSDNLDDIYADCIKRVSEYAKGTKPEDIHISRAEPYFMHQKCAAEAFRGRVLLAGDALHSNNPIGGLGLTTGIVDACAYGNAFVRVLVRGEPEELLAECANSRLSAWRYVTNPASISNMTRLFSQEMEAVKAREEFFDALESDKGFAFKQIAQLKRMGTNLFSFED